MQPASVVCGERTELRCNGTTGGLIEQRIVRSYCPGTGASCSGATTPGNWAPVRRCGPAERCDGGASPTCVPLRCAPGATMSCSTGRPGICAVGTQTCGASGDWGACVASRAPTTEACNSLDDDCDGLTDEDGVCAPTMCTVVLREDANYSDFSLDHFSGGDGTYPVGTEVSFAMYVDNNSSTRSYETSRSWLQLVSGTSIELATASDYTDRCLGTRSDRRFGSYSFRVLRSGVTTLDWYIRYRRHLDPYCGSTSPSSYTEDYYVTLTATVTCR